MTDTSPLLDHCPETLPAAAYRDPDWFARELGAIWRMSWVCVGRLADIPKGQMHRVQLGDASVILCHQPDGTLSAFHNLCRHRGAELCAQDGQALGKLITCPYHAWSYAAADGRLLATGHAQPTADFDRADHALLPVAHRLWNGFVFLSAAKDPSPLTADIPLTSLDNWPMDDLVTGHIWQSDLDCNWKVFWENYSECLHCPGIHPELCDLVPIYGKGIMGPNETRPGEDRPDPGPNLRPGAESWTMSGALCGPAFPNLTDAQRQAGYTFMTFWPSAFVVAHQDYVRSVRLQPLSPTRTRLTAEWHFAPETLAQPGFDPAEVAAFAKIVLTQDGTACEMNQRGLASPAYVRGRLMPEEYEIHHFHTWVLSRMELAQ